VTYIITQQHNYTQRFKIGILLFEDDQVILENSDNDLQSKVYNLQNITHDFNMGISTVKTKIMAFQGKDPIHNTFIILLNKLTVQNISVTLSHMKMKKERF
jgi:hypothetical protein